MKIILNQKQIWTVFLLEFKMSLKATETTHVYNAFVRELWYSGSRSAAKEDEEQSGRHRKLTAANWVQLLKLIL